MHAKVQATPLHAGVEFAGTCAEHGVQLVPQLLRSLSGRHCVPHLWKPALHEKSHALLVHSGAPFAGGVQVMHCPPQLKKPWLQANEQLVPLHATVEFAGAVFEHGVQLEPQLFTSLFDRHCEPQRWKPKLHVKSQAPPVQTALPFAGTVQVLQLAPHWVVLVSGTHWPLHAW